MLPVSIYGKKVLAIYRCGSVLHGVEKDDSDRDFIVILKNYNDVRLCKVDNADYFLFGVNKFKQAVNFDRRIADYYLIWLDNTLIAKENTLFVDESFKEEYYALINIDWKKHFKVWLRINYEYFSACFDGHINEKTLYNLYRLRSLLVHYENTRKFEYYLSAEDKALIIDYKNKKENLEKHYANFKTIFAFIKKVLDKEER
ncbi:MAG: hypothetical protein ACOX3K_05895 [Bacilli bacterium]|jgi:hypothetical protein